MNLVNAFYYVIVPVALVALAALIFEFGYPLLIVVAVAAAFLGIFAIVGLTALDLVRGRTAARARVAARPVAQAA
jgi:hypothetical protein